MPPGLQIPIELGASRTVSIKTPAPFSLDGSECSRWAEHRKRSASASLLQLVWRARNRPLTEGLVLFALVSSPCLLGCEGEYTGKGEEVQFDSTVGVFLAFRDSDKHLPIPKHLCDRLAEEYQWVPPPRTEIIEGTVEAVCGRVSWATWGGYAFAEGLNIRAQGRIRIRQDCPAGDYSISVALPILSRLSQESKTWPVVVVGSQSPKPARRIAADNDHSGFHAVPVEILHVKASDKEVRLWRVGKFLIRLVIVLCIVGVILWGVMDKLRRQS